MRRRSTYPFHFRLAVVYSIFSTALILSVGSAYYLLSAGIEEKKAQERLREYSEKIVLEMENAVRYMDYLTKDCIARPEFIESLVGLELMDRSVAPHPETLRRFYSGINRNIFGISILQNTSRLSVYNRHGDFFTSPFDSSHTRTSVRAKLAELDWIPKARAANGSKVLATPRADVWANGNAKEVFALVRMVRDPGNEIGFIEVQAPIEVLEKICVFSDQYRVLIYNAENKPIYSTFPVDKPLMDYYSGPAAKAGTRREIAQDLFSEYLGWHIVAIQDRKTMLRPLIASRNLTVGIAVIFILLSIPFSYLIAKKLTRPIRLLRDCMEEITVERLPKRPTFEFHQTAEIESLNNSFIRMIDRLNVSVGNEIKAHSLQMESHFQSLQAQVNPHFIYNMLSVIASMGLEAGSGQIASTCAKISAMLRYSTSAKDRITTLRAESAHVADYLSLMKSRYEHKLGYEIDIDERMLDIGIPKLILQPLAENSIHHGFANAAGTMKITIAGVIRDGSWQVSIVDNGCGFSPESLDRIRKRIDSYRDKADDEEPMTLDIGGLGLVNTFIRLSLYGAGGSLFDFGNNPDGGAFVRFGAPGPRP